MIRRLAPDPSYRRWLTGALLALALTAPCTGALGAEPAAEGAQPPRFQVPVKANAPLTFVVYGDTRFTQLEGVANPEARRALVAKIADESPATILIGGDLVYTGPDTGDYETYREETAAWARRRIPVYPVIGNHEVQACTSAILYSICLEHWWQAFPQLRPWRWYTVAIGLRILAVMLDSDSSLKPGSEQMTWLVHELASAGPRIDFILVVLHYPPVRDIIYPRAKDEAQVARYLSVTAATLHAQVIVIGSHVHNYERFSRDGVTYLVSGGGGAKPIADFRMSNELSQLKTSVNFHYLRFTLENDTLTGTMVRFEADDRTGNPWSEPDRFQVEAK